MDNVAGTRGYERVVDAFIDASEALGAAFVLTTMATLYPARRAALVDPAIALRYE